MSHISQNTIVHYAGLDLPVVKTADGTQVVPLKPISDLFGLRWQKQRQKLTESDFYTSYLGVSGTPRVNSNPTYSDEIFIRLDRVAAYLMTLNPNQIAMQGNIAGADLLKSKLDEWADVLHDYETLGVAHNPRHADALLAMKRSELALKIIRLKGQVKSTADRTYLENRLKELAEADGLTYQPDLLDSPTTEKGV